MTEGNGGAPPAAPTQEEIIARLGEQISLRVVQLTGLLGLPLSPEDHNRLVEKLVAEQLAVLTQILPSMTDPVRIKSHPKIGFRVRRSNETHIVTAANPRGPEEGVCAAPKRLFGRGQMDARLTLQDCIQHVVILAMLLEPGLRGLLYLCGLKYDFIEYPAVGGSPILKV